MKHLPKGGLLHAHLAGAIPIDTIIKNKRKMYVTMADNKIGRPLKYSLMSGREWNSLKIQHKKAQHKKRDPLFRYYKPLSSLSREEMSVFKESILFRACGPSQESTLVLPDYRPNPYALPKEFSNKFKLLEGLTRDTELYKLFFTEFLNEIWADNIEYMELMVNPFEKVRSEPNSINYFFGNKINTVKQLLSCQNNGPEFKFNAAVSILKQYIDVVQLFNEKLTKQKISAEFLPSYLDVRFLIGLNRTAMEREENLEIAFRVANYFITEEQNPWYKNKVLGINVVGNEFGPIGRPVDYLKWMLRIKEKYPAVHVSVHAGESAVADGHVLDSILLGAERIGHGLSLQHCKRAMQILKERELCIEACILSNKLLGYVPSVEKHPAKQWLEDKSLKVCLNTDDPGIFDTCMTDEFYYTTLSFDLSFESIKRLVTNSITSSFLPDAEKARRVSVFNDRFNKFCTDY